MRTMANQSKDKISQTNTSFFQCYILITCQVDLTTPNVIFRTSCYSFSNCWTKIDFYWPKLSYWNKIKEGWDIRDFHSNVSINFLFWYGAVKINKKLRKANFAEYIDNRKYQPETKEDRQHCNMTSDRESV